MRSRVAILVCVLAGCGAEPSAPASASARAPERTSTGGPPSPSTECRPATAAELAAIATAEAFVRDQGYTSAPPASGDLVPESIEPPEPDERAALRHDSLEPSAMGVFPHEDGASMTLLFRYQRAYLSRGSDEREADERFNTTARALVVAPDAPPHFVHQDALVAHAERLCPR